MSRRDDVEDVLRSPPTVHAGPEGNFAPGGVWATERSAYAWVADVLPERATTLETGLGVSTVLLMKWATSHTCVVPFQFEIDRLRAYCRERHIDDLGLEVLLGDSAAILPLWQGGEVDLVVIDGGHGFPTAILDWFYACAHLRQGGFLLLDDIDLPSVELGLVSFLRADPRWEIVAETKKWIGLRRCGTGSLSEQWTEQPFLARPIVKSERNGGRDMVRATRSAVRRWIRG